MEVEDKPVDSNAGEESQSETQQESHELLDETSVDDLFEAGDEDDGNDAAVSSLTLKELNEFAGRKGDNAFKSKEDFFKHYDNLKRFVGVKQEKQEKAKEEPKGDFVSRAELDAYFAEREFLSSNPTAKEHLEILKAVAKDKGVTIDKAFETLKDTLEAASAFKKERTVGVSSKQRINPMQSTRIKNLTEQAKQGNQQAEDALIEEMMGK